MEDELRLAQKLEAVGQLAAGIAHEINTPIQFVGDSMRFLQGRLRRTCSTCTTLYEELRAPSRPAPSIPQLLERARGGRGGHRPRVPARARARPRSSAAPTASTRVGSIVRAMRDFAHPQTVEQGARSTLDRALTTR